MAIKTIRVFAEYTSDGYVPMPSQGNIDYGVTVGSTFPETQPSSFQTDDPNIDVAVTTMTDFYVWIRTHGSAWNPSYTRVVRVYPDSPSINSVVMNMIVAVGGGGTTISSGGGVNYYLNGGTSQGVLDGSTYYEMNKVPVEGSGVDFFKINTTGFQNIAQFVTDAGDPGLLNIPAGNWPLGFYMSASDNSGAPKFYAEIYKYSAAGVFTLLGSSVATPEVISNGQAIDFYTSNVAIPETTLLVTDRIAIRIFVDTDGNRTINLHTQDSHLSTVGTTFTRGLTAINGLIKQVQFLAIGNAGSDAAIVSSDDTHTINLPTASATKRGLLNSTDWSTFNAKQPALSGDGFVKISGSTISYDNSSYQPLDGDLTAIGALTGTSGILKKTGANTWELDTSVYLNTTDAATTYQRKDNMASNLLASDTQYPSNNAVLAKLALKANIENPEFTGSMNIIGIESRINFYDQNNTIKYFIGYDSGFLRIYQNNASTSRFYINTDGKTFIPGTLEVGTIIKTNGTASQFLKADGTVDSNTYATTDSLSSYLLSATAASTYQRIDNMAINLLASDTQYPSNNAVLAKLALKANAADPQFTGSMNIKGAESRINFYDENDAIKYFIGYDSGFLRIYQNAGSASRLYINTDGKTFIPGTLEVGSIIKSSGTSSEFLKADGSVDSNTYVSSTALADYLLSATAASTYQRLDKMVSNLLASDTEYPNSNAVIAALALKANAANPTFTGNFTISGDSPKLYFVDTDNNPDYTIFADSGYFYIYDQTAGATRFSINSSGNINSGVGKSITAGSFIKESGTASQFLKADGSVDSNSYITSENDTLATVTGRGNTTSNRIGVLTSAAINLAGAGNSGTWIGGVQDAVTGWSIGNNGIGLKADDTTYATIGLAPSNGILYFGRTTAGGVNTLTSWLEVNSNGVANFIRARPQFNGNTILDVANYSSYALPLSGGTVTGIITNSTSYIGYRAQSDGTSTAWRGIIGSYNFTADIATFIGNYAGRSGIFGHNNGMSAWNTLRINTLGIYGMGKVILSNNTVVNADSSDTEYGLIHAGNIGSQSVSYATSAGAVNWANLVETSVTSWMTQARNGTGAKFYLAHSDGYGMHINTYTATASVYALELHNNAKQLFAVMANGAVYADGGNQVLHAANYSSYALPLSGGTMTGQILSPSMTDSVYGGAFQIRERGFVSSAQSAWSYSPAITFHWGNRSVIRMGLRSDGYMAIDDNIIVTTANLSTYAVLNRSYTNWQVSDSVINNVVGLLAWKNYGNSHVIFDASQGTSPSGTSVNATNATYAWTSSYPTLMGWNGSNTYGLRVDSARYADYSGYSLQLNGYANQTEYIILNGPANGPVWKVRYDSATANRYYDLGFKDGNNVYYEGLKVYNGGSPTWAGNPLLTSANYSSYALPLSGGTMTGTLNFANGDGGLQSATSGGISFYQNEINAGAQGGTGTIYLGWRRTSQITVGSVISSNSVIYTSDIGSFGPDSGSNNGIKINYASSGYGRVRFHQDGNNHSTIHSFGSSWTGGVSQGYINIDGQSGVNIGGWNDPDFGVAKGGATTVYRSLYVNGSGHFTKDAYPLFVYGNGSTAGSSAVGLQVYSTSGNGAIMAFHRGGYYAVNMGLDSDNVFRIGGWSASANRFQLDMSGNVTIAASMNAPSGYVSSPNPWSTANSAFFPNGITTAGTTNWIYGTVTYIGNAPSNGAGHQFNSNGTATSTGSYTASSFFESSDFRLKTLIENNPIIDGIEKLEAKLYEKNGKIELGYFAQDAELLIPYAVTKNDEGFLNLSYREVHTAKIARLEQRVAELEKQLNVA